jgi:hypothetical protein
VRPSDGGAVQSSKIGLPAQSAEASVITNYCIEFWRGAERILEYEGNENVTPEEARQDIQDLIQGMMTDIGAEDWTGCRFVVATLDGRTVFQVPILEPSD